MIFVWQLVKFFETSKVCNGNYTGKTGRVHYNCVQYKLKFSHKKWVYDDDDDWMMIRIMMSFKIFFEDEDEDSSFHHLESDFGFTMFISTENEGESSSRSSDFQSSKFYHTVTASGNFRVGTSSCWWSLAYDMPAAEVSQLDLKTLILTLWLIAWSVLKNCRLHNISKYISS